MRILLAACLFIVVLISTFSLYFANRKRYSGYLSTHCHDDIHQQVIFTPKISDDVPFLLNKNVTSKLIKTYLPVSAISDTVIKKNSSVTVCQSCLFSSTTNINMNMKPTTELNSKNASIHDIDMWTLSEFGTQLTNQYDYSEIIYPIPFNRLYNDKTTHYVDFNIHIASIPDFVHVGEVEDSSFADVDYIVVTGSSTNHLYSNINTIYSILISNLNVSIVFVDFGLDTESFSVLMREFKVINELYKSSKSRAKLYYRKFNFNNFPSWYSIDDETIRGGYSWKVISYYDILQETKRIVVWSDGGNRFPNSIKTELDRVHQYGLYTPYSGNSLQSWVHPKSAQFLGNYKMIRKILYGKGMCTGGYLFINYNNSTVMNGIINPLVQCAFTRKCISPYGSSRKNHRQDQSILSAYVHSVGIRESCSKGYRSNVRYHQECESDSSCKEQREQLKQIVKRSIRPT